MRTIRRLAAIAILISSMAPAAAAVAVGLHLLVEDHRSPAEPNAALSHHHDVIVSPGHDHQAIQSRGTTPPPAMARLGAPLSDGSPAAQQGSRSRITSTAAPPGALFLSHCSLLI